MNINKLQYYLEQYKLNFNSINTLELYKWKAVKQFQENWDLNHSNFHEMFMNSIDQTGNLLKSGNFYASRMIEQYSNEEPETTKKIFTKLFNEDTDLIQRITLFKEEIDKLNERFKGEKSYHKDRATLVYLTLKFPERYYFYKYKMFKELSIKLELDYKPIKGRIENVLQYNTYCKTIKNYITKDQEILKLHKNRINEDCYFDESYNLLTQDIIYAITFHLNDSKFKTGEEPKPTIKEVEEVNQGIYQNQILKIKLRGRTVNFEHLDREKKRIGLLGEKLILKHEFEKASKSGIKDYKKKIEHSSINQGDGLGYDIKSIDSNGDEIYIEVKTTRQNIQTPFFITRNELECSILYSSKFYLYRVYNFDEKQNTGSILKLKGDMSYLCNDPQNFKIKLKKSR